MSLYTNKFEALSPLDVIILEKLIISLINSLIARANYLVQIQTSSNKKEPDFPMMVVPY